MRILLTGADGYIGSGVARELIDRGHDVIGFGLRKMDLESSRFRAHHENIFTLSLQEIKGMQPDIVIHLAWRNGFAHGDDSHVDDLPGHYHFLKRCVEAGVPRLAIMGTMHEVGYHEGAVTAKTPCNPTTPYGIAKNALRQLSESVCAHSGCALVWMRGFYLVSADGCGNSIFSKIVRAAQEGKKVFPFTSGRNLYDFLDYEDFCRMACDLALDERVTGTVNICSGSPESLASRVERFIDENGLDIDLEYGAFPDRPYDSPGIWGDKPCGLFTENHEYHEVSAD